MGIANVVTNLILPRPKSTQKRHITTICDGLSALETVERKVAFIQVKHKHADLISITSSLWDTSTFQFTREHVKAHQNDLQTSNNRKIINCQMDSLVKKIVIEKIISKNPTSFHTTTI